jgi:hypothetical protein
MASAAVYHNFGSVSVDQLDKHIHEMLLKFSNFPPADTYIRNHLIADKGKICETLTCRFFTCGSKADSRGEGTNSRIKGGNENSSDI